MIAKGTCYLFRSFIGVWLLAGCVAQPTKVSVTEKRELELLVDKAQGPIDLTDQTVVLDARPSFEYGLNRISNSLHFPWDNLAETTLSGEVVRDLRKAGVRLALSGLEPQTPVVIVGNGPRGNGEEGRLAWTLIYLGFQDVQVGVIEMFRRSMTPNASAPAKNVPVWTVSPRSELQVSKEEFAKLAMDPKGRLESRTWIVDVRTDKEYANKSGSKNAPDINAIHIPWTEFYTAKGRPDARVKSKLEAVGIKPNDRIIMISNKGVRSGAAAYSLLALGFSRTQNFTAGWNSLLTDRN